MTDIAPYLLEQVQKEFQTRYAANTKIRNLLEASTANDATYATANEYASEVGGILSDCIKKISGDELPDGKMYYNIAEKVLSPVMENNYELVSEVCEQVQTTLNKNAGIGLKAQVPEYNTSRTKGTINLADSSDLWDNVKQKVAGEILDNTRRIVDDSVRKNASWQRRCEMEPKVIRYTIGDCCDWCAEVAGTYEYDDVSATGDDVWRRHKNCNCVVEYYPGKGTQVQDAHSKIWTDVSQEGIRQRIELAERNKINLPKEVRDVTKEYISNAIPGKGELTTNGVEDDKHEAERQTAEWLIERYGGDVSILPESGVRGEKMPDYIWAGSPWELKRATSKTGIDSRVRKAATQITSLGHESGGIILDVTGSEMSDKDVVNYTAERLAKRAKTDTDVIIKRGDKTLRILRHEKR